MPTVPITTIRTDLKTGQSRTVPASLELRDGNIYLVGGPTGYESIPRANLDATIVCDGWLACLGTPGRFDRCFVPAVEMAKLKSLISERN